MLFRPLTLVIYDKVLPVLQEISKNIVEYPNELRIRLIDYTYEKAE